MKKASVCIAIIATLFILLGLGGQTLAQGVGCQHGDEMASYMADEGSMPCCDEATCSMVHCLVVVPLISASFFSASDCSTADFFVYKNAHHNINAPPLDRPPIG